MATQALQFPTYQPSMRIISAITNANPTQVTTTFAHQYITGTIVRLDIPIGYGMQQANQLTGEITVTGTTTFLININTTYFDAFVVPALQIQFAQVVPIAEDSAILTAAVQNVLPY